MTDIKPQPTPWTPEPWQIHQSHFYGPNPNRTLIGTVCNQDGKTNLKANAQRIIACVNGCKGLNPKMIPEIFFALGMVTGEIEQFPHPLSHKEKIKIAVEVMTKAREGYL